MTGRARTTVKKRRMRSDKETVLSDEDEELLIPELLIEIKEAIAANQPLGAGSWKMSQSVALGNLDESHKYETIMVEAMAYLQCPNKPSKVMDTIDLCTEICEDRISEKIDEIHSMFDEDEDDE